MASEREEMVEMPNLKICIDNSDDISEGEVESIESEQEQESEVQVETTITYDDDDLFVEAPKKEVKKYENKSGDFVTGLEDLSPEVQRQKMEERAKRFNITNPTPRTVDENELKRLYESLGLSKQSSGERGIRHEAIHLRGVDDMSTKDVFKFFEQFGPGSVEWIDDSSCNVVWMDESTAARAMLALSRSPDSESEEEGGDGDKMELSEWPYARDAKNKGKIGGDGDKPNVMSSDDEDTKADEETGEKQKMAIKKEEGMDVETTEDDGAEQNENSYTQSKNARNEIVLPPGKWRIGKKHSKANVLYLRFATKADRKQPGAERKSQYYRKYGNPNFGGMRGIISESKKKRMRYGNKKKVIQEARDIINRRQEQQEEEADEEYYDDNEEGLSIFDLQLREAKARIKEQKLLKEKAAAAAILGKKRKRRDSESSGGDSDEVHLDEELEELLKPSPEKRYMRMHADDEYEKIQKRKKRAAATSTSVHTVLDARSRITGKKTSQYQRHYESASEEEDFEDELEEEEDLDEVVPQFRGDLRNRLGNRLGNRRPRDSHDEKPLRKYAKLRVEIEQD